MPLFGERAVTIGSRAPTRTRPRAIDRVLHVTFAATATLLLAEPLVEVLPGGVGIHGVRELLPPAHIASALLAGGGAWFVEARNPAMSGWRRVVTRSILIGSSAWLVIVLSVLLLLVLALSGFD